MAKFRVAYEGRVEPMPDRSDWPEVNLGFKIFPPRQKRAAGRPKTQRIRGCLEKNPNKKKAKGMGTLKRPASWQNQKKMKL